MKPIKTKHALCGLMSGLLLLAAAPASYADTVTYTVNFTDTATLPNYLGISGTVSFDSADIAANPGGWITVTGYSFTGNVNGRDYSWELNASLLNGSPSGGTALLEGHVNATGTAVDNLNFRTLYSDDYPVETGTNFCLDFWGVGDRMVRVHWGIGSGGKTRFAIGDVAPPVDPDTDGDGVPDSEDAFPNDPTESVDTDGDGVGDNADACDESDISLTVIIDEIDTYVFNQLLDDGCTINDLIAGLADSAFNHGAFVSGVAHLTNDLRKSGVISNKEKSAIQKAAAKSGR